MREGMSYIKDSNDFMHKIKDLKYIPNDALLVTADVVGLYPSIPHETRLQALDVERTKRFRYMILSKWQHLFLKTTILNSMEKLNTKNQGLP